MKQYFECSASPSRRFQRMKRISYTILFELERPKSENNIEFCSYSDYCHHLASCHYITTLLLHSIPLRIFPSFFPFLFVRCPRAVHTHNCIMCIHQLLCSLWKCDIFFPSFGSHFEQENGFFVVCFGERMKRRKANSTTHSDRAERRNKMKLSNTQ